MLQVRIPRARHVRWPGRPFAPLPEPRSWWALRLRDLSAREGPCGWLSASVVGPCIVEGFPGMPQSF